MSPRAERFYWSLWRAAAIANGWKQSDEAQRHRIHVEALGYDASHKDFTPAEFDKIIAAMKLATDPLDLDQVIETDHPEHGERRRLLWRIRQDAPSPAYIETIARDRFHTRDWQDLDNDRLTQLRNILSNRARARARKDRELQTI